MCMYIFMYGICTLKLQAVFFCSCVGGLIWTIKDAFCRQHQCIHETLANHPADRTSFRSLPRYWPSTRVKHSPHTTRQLPFLGLSYDFFWGKNYRKGWYMWSDQWLRWLPANGPFNSGTLWLFKTKNSFTMDLNSPADHFSLRLPVWKWWNN